MKRALLLLLVIIVIGTAGGYYYYTHSGSSLTINTVPVTRGEIIDAVGATGTLQAVTTVQVGSQVSGNVSWLGADFNSIVHKAQVIARIDPSIFQAQVEQARANVVRSTAAIVQSQADLERIKVSLTDAQQKFARVKELNARNLSPQSDLDTATTAVDSAKAQLQASQAALQSAQAQLVQSQASLNQNQVNLDHCIITAPIDGIVTQRSVDVGQTVAASLQSPTLFVIAADLTEMQVNASIDEADVGRIRPGQTVTFRVDAYPTDNFTGTVTQIRLQPVVSQGVTTYGTIVSVRNDDLRLKPGMTANLKVQVARRADAVRVPNGALRFRPTTETFALLKQPVPPELANAGGGNGGGGRNGAGRGAGQAATGGSQSGAAAPPQQQASAAPQAPAAPQTGRAGGAPGAAPAGRGGAPAAGGGPQGGNAGDPDRRAAMMDRIKAMPPEQQQQALARMKGRGGDANGAQTQQAPAEERPAVFRAKYGDPQSAATIDALFAPLPPVESTGRAWLYLDKQLKPVRVRIGISDGTYTELLSGEGIDAGTELVTSVAVGTGRQTATVPAAGNPMMPGGGRGGPGGPGGPPAMRGR
jgi:HlyD family secretion protein